jgi:3-hydroxybutyryl-CoA dehydrogenase
MTNYPAAVDDFKHVGVVGGGLMGSGIAEVCARAGLDVLVSEIDPGALDAARARIRGSLAQAAHKGKLTAEAAAAAADRISYTTDLDDFADRDVIVAAVAEQEAVKADVFTRLDKLLVRPDAILASNTSSIPIMKLAMSTGRADRVIGIHFFNAVLVLPLVELIPSLLTSAATIE